MLNKRKDGSKEYWSLFGFNVFYKNVKEYTTRYRILCFCLDVLNDNVLDKINSLENRMLTLEKEVSAKKPMLIIDEKVSFEIRKDSVLLIETNKFHSELLPGIAKYFIDFGYNVDILLNYSEFKLKPFALYDIKKIRIFSIDQVKVLNILKEHSINKYKYIYFNSDCVNYGKNTSIDFFKNNVTDKNKLIYMCHHPESFDSKGMKTCMLGDYKFFGEIKPEIVIPAFIGHVNIRAKNQVTKFVVIGNIDRKRKNFDLLISTCKKLVENNIKNFKVDVIAKTGGIEIPGVLKDIIEFKGALPYADMYKELEGADFILALLDKNIEEHRRYIDSGISGTILLMLYFSKLCLIEDVFAIKYNLNPDNSIVYDGSEGFLESMKASILMSKRIYLQKQQNLSELRMQIYEKSKINFEKLVKNIRRVA